MKKQIQNTPTQFLLYKTSNEDIKLEALLEDETIWLTILQIGELFQKSRSTINEHILNIYKEHELKESDSMRKIGNSDFSTKPTNYYNLDVIISVGYRVKSIQGTRFRQWATARLKEYIVKGFTMDDERLKNPNQPFGKDYFDEQLERIRDIRSSERRLYQKITDIYAQCSADYEVDAKITKEFFATVQNKLHWAIVGETAAEIIYNRVDSDKENMGLTSWKNAPKGKIRKTDVWIAKNYLLEDELNFFNRIVNMYLEFAELQATKKNVMYMKDWVSKLDAFIELNEYGILKHKGKISHNVAVALAYAEFEKYRIVQDRLFESDFDKMIKALEDKDEDTV